MVGGRIQAFPWTTWREEFQLASQHGLRLMEWTLDQENIYDNPLMTADGRAEIKRLCGAWGVAIPSVTGDCFMQSPFWKADGATCQALHTDFLAIADACADLGIGLIVVPLVDNGRIENHAQEERLVIYLRTCSTFLARRNLKVVFESDFCPNELARFIQQLDQDLFGINYDIGNSAALGYAPNEEFSAYGHRILNVHVKDRVLGGTTVPLGTGHARFDAVFENLARIGYQGNFILQTARAADHDHVTPLQCYRDMTAEWVRRFSA